MSDKPSHLPEIHRLLPQDTAAEQGVLASLLLDPPRVFALCEERGVSAEWFHIPAHAAVFTALEALHREKKTADFITLCTHLRDAGTLESSGGAPFVTSLFTFLPTAANAAHYLATVEEKHTLRRIIALGTRYASAGYDPQQTPGELLDAFQADVMALDRPGADASGHFRHIRHGLIESVQGMEEAYRHRGQLQGLPSGLTKLDEMTMGFKPQQLVFIAGRPGMGKSAFLMNLARAIAETGAGVGFFTLEMSEREQCDRFLCSEAGMSLQKVRDGYFSESEMSARIPAAIAKLGALPIHIDETSAISIQDVRARVRAFCRAHPDTRAVVIDYVQLMVSATRRARENRALELAEISGGLKRLAKELKITVFAGAQLNRDADNESKPPKLSQFRESGALEQDCDIAILLHRPGYHDKEAPQDEAVAILAKHRNGPVGEIPLRFIGKHTRFEDAPFEQTGDQHRTNAGRQKQTRQREFTDHMRPPED